MAAVIWTCRLVLVSFNRAYCRFAIELLPLTRYEETLLRRSSPRAAYESLFSALSDRACEILLSWLVRVCVSFPKGLLMFDRRIKCIGAKERPRLAAAMTSCFLVLLYRSVLACICRARASLHYAFGHEAAVNRPRAIVIISDHSCTGASVVLRVCACC